MRKILIISYYFPPIISVASNRVFSIAQYCFNDDDEIRILTAYNNDPNHQEMFVTTRIRNFLIFPAFTPTNSKANFNFIRRAFFSLYNRIIVGNQHKMWYFFSKIYLFFYLKKNDYQIVLSSSAPGYSHLLASYVRSKSKNSIWIADLRDELSGNIYSSDSSSNIFTERLVMSKADIVSTVSLPLVANLKKRYPDVKNRIIEVQNGYNFEIKKREVSQDFFHIVFTGSFYGDISPNLFLQALSDLKKEHLITRFQVSFIGRFSSRSIIIPSNLHSNIKLANQICRYEEAISITQNASILLLIIPNNGRKGVYSGKLFDYLGSLRPILALLDPNDVAAALISDCNAGYIANSSDISSIKKQILFSYNDWKNCNPYNPCIERILKLHRRFQNQDLRNRINTLFIKKNRAYEK